VTTTILAHRCRSGRRPPHQRNPGCCPSAGRRTVDRRAEHDDFGRNALGEPVDHLPGFVIARLEFGPETGGSPWQRCRPRMCGKMSVATGRYVVQESSMAACGWPTLAELIFDGRMGLASRQISG
jgi:hypothetical protein